MLIALGISAFVFCRKEHSELQVTTTNDDLTHLCKFFINWFTQVNLCQLTG